MTNQAISGKTRTRQHVIADLAVNYLERQVLLCGYTGQRVQHDYGYDFTAVTYDQRGQSHAARTRFRNRYIGGLAMMPETRIRFATLRDFLSDLGFRQVGISDAHIAFQHDATDTLLALPVYKANQYVAPHHVAMFRAQLDAKGILDGDEFDRLVASARIKQTAS